MPAEGPLRGSLLPAAEGWKQRTPGTGTTVLEHDTGAAGHQRQRSLAPCAELPHDPDHPSGHTGGSQGRQETALSRPHGRTNTPEPPSTPQLCSRLPSSFLALSGSPSSLEAGQGPGLIALRPQAEHSAQHTAGSDYMPCSMLTVGRRVRAFTHQESPRKLAPLTPPSPSSSAWHWGAVVVAPVCPKFCFLHTPGKLSLHGHLPLPLPHPCTVTSDSRGPELPPKALPSGPGKTSQEGV